MEQNRVSSEPDAAVTVAGLSDVGCVRKNNEDALGFFPESDPERGTLLIVADGMGGAAAGEVASGLALETVREVYFRPADWPGVPEALRTAILAANRAILQGSQDEPRHVGMGTTCTVAVIRGRELWLGHVGDSRAYLIADGEILQVTRDHSLAAELERQGKSPSQTARVKNVLTRCLGMGPEVKVDFTAEPLRFDAGASLVLCSDGLSNLVESGEILHQVAMHLPDRACHRLIEIARERGGPDNITVLIARRRDT